MTKHDKEIMTFTKRWISRLMWLFVLWITLTYILAFMGKESIAEALSQDVMTGGVVLFAGYMAKAFFETYASEKNKCKKAVCRMEHGLESEEEDD